MREPALTLGTDGPILPALGLGCMGMSEFYGETDDRQSLAVLARAWDLGVRMFDTADMYGNGHNEDLLARFLKEGRAAAFVATKFGIRKATGEYARTIDNSPAYIREACEASLRRLGVERIDLYYVHRVESGRPIEETMGVLAELVASGKGDSQRRADVIVLCTPSAPRCWLEWRPAWMGILPNAIWST